MNFIVLYHGAVKEMHEDDTVSLQPQHTLPPDCRRWRICRHLVFSVIQGKYNLKVPLSLTYLCFSKW